MKLRPVETGVWTSTITEDNTLLIPNELLEELNWPKQTHIYYEIKDKSLIIKKAPSD
mgnify:CR=1 FL=1